MALRGFAARLAPVGEPWLRLRLSCTPTAMRMRRAALVGAPSGARALRLALFPVSRAHPDKAAKGGEDAHFVLAAEPTGARRVTAAGVADGVGGWADQGVDAGLYSRALMSWAHRRLAEAEVPCIVDALAFSYRMTKVLGSCTACLALLREEEDGGGVGQLETLNLGDSGLLLARPGAGDGAGGAFDVVFKTTEQQHRFNMPYQLGTFSQDLPQHADLQTIDVRAGDVCILATDGVWDNVFEERLLEILSEAAGDYEAAARKIAETAMRIGQSRSNTPFSTKAWSVGIQHSGGKLDDVTVVLAHVVPS